MEQETSLDTGTFVSDEQETIATEGIYSEEVETAQDVETTEVEEVVDPVKEQPKQSKGVKKLLAEKNDLKSRVQQLEEENALVKLEKAYGSFETESVLEIKRQHPSLTYEESYLLRKSKQPQPEREPRRSSSIVGTEARSTSS